MMTRLDICGLALWFEAVYTRNQGQESEDVISKVCGRFLGIVLLSVLKI